MECIRERTNKSSEGSKLAPSKRVLFLLLATTAPNAGRGELLCNLQA